MNVGDLLSGSWELTQKIFETLSFREVARFRAVCKLWADVGAKILERRRKLHYVTVHPHNVPTTEGKVIIGGVSPSTLLENFFERIVSKPRYCIGFCNGDWLTKADFFIRKGDQEKFTLPQYLLHALPSTCDFSLVSASGIIGTVEHRYQGHLLESANNVNKELLSFLCNKEEIDGRPIKRSRPSFRDRRRGERQVNVNTPGSPPNESSSSSLSSSSSETDKLKDRSSVGYSIEVEAGWNNGNIVCTQTEAVSLILIPHHPGVKLKFFHLSEESFFKNCRPEKVTSENLLITPEEFNGLTSLSADDDLKALLLFDVGLDEEFTAAFLQSALNRQNQKLAIGGGVIESFDTGKTGEKKDDLQFNLGVAICGPNVMAASVVIPESVTNPKSLDKYMQQLKSCGLPEEQSVAFMFTCCGRGFFWYRGRGTPFFDYSNVESKAFRKVFPNTPIFGFFGEGEIGMLHLPKFSKSEVEKEETPPKKRRKKLIHQFTTIIVLLSFL